MSFYHRPGCRANDLHCHHLLWLLCLIFSNSLIIPRCNLATKLSDRYAIYARICLCLDDTVISQKRKMLFYDFLALLRQPRYARNIFYDIARIATQSAICLHPDCCTGNSSWQYCVILKQFLQDRKTATITNEIHDVSCETDPTCSLCTDQCYKNVLEKFHFCSCSVKFQHFQNFKKQPWRDDQRHIYRTLGYKIQQCKLTYTQATTSSCKKLDNLHIFYQFLSMEAI